MKFLIVDTYYPAFIHHHYTSHPGLENQPYAEQWRVMMDQCFGTADFYSFNLNIHGCEAEEVVVNCDALQRQWAREHDFRLWAMYPLYRLSGRIRKWQLAVLKAQVEDIRPDVLYIHNLNFPGSEFLKEIKKSSKLIVGQIAAPFHKDLDLTPYDLLVTSFPHYMDEFRKRGLNSEYLPFAFDVRILAHLDPCALKYQVTFAGGYSSRHARGIEVFEQLSQQVPVDFWGYGIDSIPASSPILTHFHGELWGLEMYRVLAQSNISLNRHVDVAENYANNMRLYEVTGVGTCLVTDWKENLAELFEPDTEIITYSCAEDCIEKVRYLLDHDDEREAIAHAGQRRTLGEHTYHQLMEKLADIVDCYLQRPGAATRKLLG